VICFRASDNEVRFLPHHGEEALERLERRRYFFALQPADGGLGRAGAQREPHIFRVHIAFAVAAAIGDTTNCALIASSMNATTYYPGGQPPS
jgi:hypothetical protein